MLNTYFPAAPGETATSLLDAAAFISGSAAARALSARCFRRCAPLVGTLPSRAKQFCEATEGAYGVPEEVVFEFSIAPLHMQGMGASLKRKLLFQLIEGLHSRTCAARLRPFIQCGNRHGLQCPECAQQAFAKYGRRVSYCAHCIDFVTRCPLHHCKLVCDDDCSSLEEMLACRRSVNATSNATRYAQVAASIACAEPSTSVTEAIRGRLQAKHYLSETGRCQLDKLRDAFAALFSDGFEDVRLNELLASTDLTANFVHMLNRVDRAIHPVLLVLLEWLSFDIEALPARSCKAKSNANVEAPASDTCEAKRHEWLRHQAQCSSMGRKQIRTRAPALYTWLYRHDREWLTNNQVAPLLRTNRKRKATPPASFTHVVLTNESPVYRSGVGREPLPSAYQTRLAYGMNDYLFDRAAEAFNGVGRAAQLPGHREVFITRRINGARLFLESRGLGTDVASVARGASLRVSTVAGLYHKGAC